MSDGNDVKYAVFIDYLPDTCLTLHDTYEKALEEYNKYKDESALNENDIYLSQVIKVNKGRE
jgi:hypothetical protein